jgi:hypothetical protein
MEIGIVDLTWTSKRKTAADRQTHGG